MATKEEVKRYWQENPLLSHELGDLGSASFFSELDRAKREDSDIFAMGYWEFGAFAGKRLLDVGCGPGWVAMNYALGGARVCAMDLTFRAAQLSKAHLKLREARADVIEADAESIPFRDGSFDVVVSSGVLHHTPDTPRAIGECHRVLKSGGIAKLTFYHKGILHHPVVFGFTRFVMNLFSVKHPGADLSKDAMDVDDFIRQYDGAANPVGIGMTTGQWRTVLRDAGFRVTGSELHFFPKRFIPLGRFIPRLVHRALDRLLGTMIYFHLEKP
ncbi:MAG: class I SAM-dependent methyltransferase [Nitrospinota bacterium]|nr:class I SAM-dependent methyltransferase [Nitrospinota bacterium]